MFSEPSVWDLIRQRGPQNENKKNKTKQNKTKQNKTKQNKTGEKGRVPLE